MAGEFEIAEGVVTIDADIAAALKNVRSFLKALDKGLDAAERAASTSGTQAGTEFTDEMAAAVEKNSGKVTRAIDRATRAAGTAGGAAGGSGGGRGSGPRDSRGRFIGGGGGGGGRAGVPDLIPGDSGRGIFGRLMDGAKGFFSAFTKGFTDAIGAGIDGAKGLWQQASTFFQQLGNIGGGLGSVVMIAAMAAMIPVILGLGGALVQLSAALLALPAAGAVALGIIAPLMVAFKGFGEAVGAGLSGDVQAFNEALKGMPKSMQQVVREFVALKPILTQVKNTIQSNFWKPLIGASAQIGALLKGISGNLGGVSSALGFMFREILNVFTSTEAIKTFNAVLETTKRVIQIMEPAFGNLFGMLLDLIPPALPFVERLARGFQFAAAWLSGLVSESAKSGKITGWLERAWAIGKDLWNVVKELFLVFKNLFSDTGDEGQSFLVDVANALKEFNTWLTSDDGKEAIDDLAGSIAAAGAMVRGVLRFFSLLGDVWLGMKAAGIATWAWLKSAWAWLGEAASSVGRWFSDTGSSIWGWLQGVGSAIGGFFSDLGGWFVSAWNTVTTWGEQIVNWFAALPGRIGAWLSALPGRARQLWVDMFNTFVYGIGWVAGIVTKFVLVDLPKWFSDSWEWTKRVVSDGVTATLSFIASLPGRVWNALSSFGSLLAGLFISAWEWTRDVTTRGVNAVVDWVRNLPGRVWAALSGLASMIGGFFSDAWNRGRDNTRRGIDDVMAWVRGLPDRVRGALSGAGSWLVDAGRDMIRGLVNGLEDTLSWAVNKARDAASRIKQGFLDAVEINSPSRAMRVEMGRQLLPGMVQGIEDTMPRTMRYLGATGDAIVQGMRQPAVNVAGPNVQVGAPNVVVKLDGREIGAAVTLEPARVAASGDEGRRQRNWIFSPRARR